MELTRNKKIGLLIIGIGLLIGYIIYAFNTALTDLISISQCGEINCPHEAALKFQTNISIGILFAVIVIGVIFLFMKEKVLVSAERKRENLEKIKTLTEEEKKIYELTEKEGSMFQSDLVEKSGFDNVVIIK
ncbi:hypothetical protein J4427_02500 [Candidatus Woesearchaeota archaeon]|nr:hypothetical protein [Candidatus Woesearchaeota archaeon]